MGKNMYGIPSVAGLFPQKSYFCRCTGLFSRYIGLFSGYIGFQPSAEHMTHGGEYIWDAWTCISLSAKEPLFRVHRALFRIYRASTIYGT